MPAQQCHAHRGLVAALLVLSLALISTSFFYFFSSTNNNDTLSISKPDITYTYSDVAAFNDSDSDWEDATLLHVTVFDYLDGEIVNQTVYYAETWNADAYKLQEDIGLHKHNRGIAWMLAQRKADNLIGHKILSSVTIFGCANPDPRLEI